jgi:hypothetical protein
MGTSRWTKRAAQASEDLKTVSTMLRDKSAGLLKRSGDLATARPL